MEETVFKIFMGLMIILSITVLQGVILVIIKILFLFFPEINIMGIHMVPLMN